MNRSNRHLLFGGVLCLILASFYACSAKASGYKQDLNNYSHQSIICGVYYVMVAQCLRNRGDNESTELAKRYDALAKEASDEGYQTAKLAGLSEKAVKARLEIEIQDQMSDIDNKCINISVVNLKHGLPCKAFMEGRGPALDLILSKMRGTHGH
jgi:hypothetical protein